MTTLTTKIDEKESVFSSNYSLAKGLLDKYAQPGHIEFVANETIPVISDDEVETLTFTELLSPITVVDNQENEKTFTHATVYRKAVGPVYSIYLTSTNPEAGATAHLLSYVNAIINTGLSANSGAGTWPQKDDKDVPTLYDGISELSISRVGTTTKYNNMLFKWYVDKSTSTEVNSTCTKNEIAPLVCTTAAEREQFLANFDTPTYSSFATYKSKYTKALTYIKEWPKKTDADNLEASTTIVRRGLYQIQHDYWTDIVTQIATDPYGYYAAKRKYSTPFNLVQWRDDAMKEQKSLWAEIYGSYSYFIAETNFSDEQQLSSEGLFMAAMQAFAKYREPTVDYSTTIINTSAISNIQDKSIAIGDIIYVYNPAAMSQYSGVLKVTIPTKKLGKYYGDDSSGYEPVYYANSSQPNVRYYSPANSLQIANGWCKVYCGKDETNSYDYPFYYGNGTVLAQPLAAAPLEDATAMKIHNIHSDEVYTDIYLECPSLETATGLMLNKANLDTISLFTTNNSEPTPENQKYIVSANILNIEMGEIVKPIQLQVTGVTRKLRDATTQVTVSTDRTMDLVFQRLIKQARL